jgi:hypothetical protein
MRLLKRKSPRATLLFQMRKQWFVGLPPMGGSALRLQLPVVLRLQQLRAALGLAVLLVRELQPLVVEQPLEDSLRRLLPRPLGAALGMVMMIKTLP